MIVTIHFKKASNLNLSTPSSQSCSIALPRERRRRIAFDQRVAIQIYILNVHIQIQTAKLNLNWSWIESSRIPLKTNLPPIKQMVARLFLRHQLFQMTLSRAHGLFGKLETPAPFADTVATICTRELPGKLHQFTNIATYGNYASLHQIWYKCKIPGFRANFTMCTNHFGKCHHLRKFHQIWNTCTICNYIQNWCESFQRRRIVGKRNNEGRRRRLMVLGLSRSDLMSFPWVATSCASMAWMISW